MSTKLTPDAIVALIPSSYERAYEAQDLFFFHSMSHTVTEGGIDFQIRHCPALLNKPALPAPRFDDQSESVGSSTRKSDPFAPPYVSNLLVGELDETDDDEHAEYVILLNKFSVIPHHFLLVTKEFSSQSSPLLPLDLLVAYKILLASAASHHPAFAFYNCGDRSGASQAHKHVQFIPLEDVTGPPIEKLAQNQRPELEEKPFSIGSLPYANHVFRFPRSLPSSPPSAQLSVLSDAFMSLLDLALTTVRHQPSHPRGPPSYNVLLTLQHMHLIPRSKETYRMKENGDEVSVNALGFAGMLLVKSEAELEAVKKEGVGTILRGVGMERIDGNICEPQLVDLE